MRSRLATVAAVLLLSGCGSPPTPASEPAPEPESAAPSGTPIAVLGTDFGEIRIKLLPEVAPETVANFIELAELGFYKRTTFHRVMPGQMIQGGDPNSRDNDPYNDGQGGSGKRLKAEFSDLPMDRGSVAMTRQPDDPDSASCQFFIVLRRVREWDGEYTVFGEVEEGIEVADRISEAPRSTDQRLRSHPVGKILISNVSIEYREPAGG